MPSSNRESQTLLIIDAAVIDAATLTRHLAPTVRVVALNAHEDGVLQIARSLAGCANLDALHVVSHGADGRLFLGNGDLSIDDLREHRASLDLIGAALVHDAPIVLYGCEVARTGVGRRFIEALAELTGHPVIASATRTGAAALGGDWKLEARTAPVEIASLIGEEARARYAHVLPAPDPLALSSLDGTNGFRIDGALEDGRFGFSVASAGDLNGDGLDDLIIGAYRATPDDHSGAGSTYVIFGRPGGFEPTLAVSTLNGNDGFRIDGIENFDFSGFSVSTAGDINGDRLDDLIIGAPNADANGTNRGSSYVILGKAASFSSAVALSSLTGNNGFQFEGIADSDQSGRSVRDAGDVNGDGFDDLIIGAPNAAVNGNGSGSSYVVFGHSSGFPSSTVLSFLNGSNGFRIDGEAPGDGLGRSVSAAGDLNGDGLDDLLIGAPGADPNGKSGAGSSYVVFGRAGSYASAWSTSSLNGSNGFRIDGDAPNAQSGYSVSAAGDVNGDGFDDLVVGAFGAPAGSNEEAGTSYVVFGRAGGFAATLAVSSLDGSDGFRIEGETEGDRSGRSISAAGDLNGDGFDDLIIGAHHADSNNQANAGASYVVLGRGGAFAATLALSSLDGSSGFRIEGVNAHDGSGRSVSAAGDINGDGFDDVVIGAYGADPSSMLSGSSYVVFGGNFTSSVNHLGTPSADALSGTSTAESFVTGSGNDTITTGGGADVVYAAGGDDLIRIADTEFQRIDGGPGFDTLVLTGAGIDFVLGKIADNRLRDIEIIDLTGSGDNSLYLDRLEVLQTSIRAHTLRIDGNAGDVLHRDAFWIFNAPFSPTGYAYYSNGAATLLVDTDLVQIVTESLASLDGTTGFKLSGAAAGDEAGFSVNGAGDINGDGFDDVIVGARNTAQSGASSGAAYVVFGKAGGFSADIDLGALDGSNSGFKILSPSGHAWTGRAVGSAGDINADGYDDLLIGAGIADANGVDSGAAYVVFGKAVGFANISLSSVTDGTVFRLAAIAAGDQAGSSVDHAGDVNGDGFDDIIVGARRADPNGVSSGAAYVVFGKADGFSNDTFSSLNGTNGFRIHGAGAGDYAGYAVAGAGDVNGDGFDDVLVGARYNDGPGRSNAGAGYIVFGKGSSYDVVIDLAALDPPGTAKLAGANAGEQTGFSVQGAGDLNRDGFDDIVVGAHVADPPAGTDAGVAYVVFGGTALGAGLDLGTLNGSNGFRVTGAIEGDAAGISVSGIGDFNGDGHRDLLVGAWRNDEGGVDAGAAYVLYGRAAGFDPSISLDDLPSERGFKLTGVAEGDEAGFSVRGAGDVDGDGYDDLIVGAFDAQGKTADAGAAYVVFGGNFSGAVAIVAASPNGAISLASTAEADTLTGSSVAERILGGRGDDALNGAGGEDALVGGIGNDTLVGGEGNDTLDGGEGTDTLDGGAGDDTYLITDALDTISDTAGTDTVRTALAFVLPGTIENLTLIGAANVNASGNALNNVIIGNAGVNRLDGQGGTDTYDGGAGDDVFVIHSLSTIINDLSGFDEAETYVESYTLPDTVEILRIGSGFDIVLGYGNGVDNYLYANGLGQELHGFAGNDRLYGNLAEDRLEGGSGIDTLYGGDAADILLGQDDDDRLEGEAGDDLMFAGAGNDVVLGGTGADRAWGENGDDLIFGGADNDSLLGEFGNDRLWGEDGDDDLFGGWDNDQLIGEAGNDRLFGDVGADDLFGGDGLDLLLGENDDDRLFGGNDADDLFGQAGADLLLGEDGNDRLWGGTDADLLFGQAGDDLLQGEEDHDRLFGGDGNDLLFGQAGDDELQGEANDDRLFGGAGSDHLFGQAGADELQGEDDADFLYGGDGADVLWGQGGNDTLYGEAGADRFVFTQSGGADTIADFEDGVDLLDLRFYAGATIGNTTVAAQGADTLVTFTGGETALLVGINPASISGADFLFA